MIDGCDPTSAQVNEDYFGDWMIYAMKAESFRASEAIEAMTWFDLPADEEAAYDAPFPSRIYMAGPRKFPWLMNEVPGTTAEACEGLTKFERPFLARPASPSPPPLSSAPRPAAPASKTMPLHRVLAPATPAATSAPVSATPTLCATSQHFSAIRSRAFVVPRGFLRSTEANDERRSKLARKGTTEP